MVRKSGATDKSSVGDIAGQRWSGATDLASCSGMLFTRMIASSSEWAQESLSWPASVSGWMMRCRQISKVSASQPWIDDPQVAFDIGLEIAARSVDLDDAAHDVFHLPVLGLVVDAEQDRIGTAESDVGGPGGVRVLLVVLHVGKHAVPHLLEEVLAGRRRTVGGLEQLVGLPFDDGGEERPLVREVVVHQRSRYAGPLGDLVDANLVVGPLAEDFRA